MSPLSPFVADRALRRLGVGVAVWVWVCWLWLAGAGLAQAWAQSPQPAFRFKGMTDSTVPSLGPKVLSPEERQFIASLPVLRVAMQAVGAPPYEVVGADGQISGFQAELLARLAVPLGLRLKPVVYATWPEVLTALREGQADIVLTLKVTQQRLSFLEFALGTVPQPSALFARVGTAVPVSTARMALEREYASNDYVARQFPKASIVPAPSTIEALRAVADGRADYYLGSLLEALDFLAHEPVPGIEVREILRTGTGHHHIGVRKALAPLAQILNKGITRERADTDFVQPAASVPGPLRELRLERALVPDAEQAAALARRAVWRVGAVRGLAMLNDADARGAHSGIAAEYTEHVASRIGVGVEVGAFDSVAEMLDALRSARIDFAPFLTPTPERSREFVFSTPYLEMPYMLLARSDAPLFWDLGSLRGKRLALALQHPLRPALAQRYPEVQVVDARNGNEAMDMVARGDADAAVEVKLFANLRINGDPGAQLRVLAPVEDLPARFAFASGPENASLIPLINRALAEVKPAEAERMLRRWVATDQDPPFPWRKYLPVLSVSVIALLTLIGGTLWWTRRLAREVQARRRADAQLDDVGRALPGVAFRYTIDPGTGFRGSFYSSGAEAFLGLTPVRDKPLPNLMATRMPPDQAAAALALQSACGRSGKPFHFTGQYQHPDGRALWLKVEVQQRRDVGGAVVWTGYIVDVSA